MPNSKHNTPSIIQEVRCFIKSESFAEKYWKKSIWFEKYLLEEISLSKKGYFDKK
jgi:hypothetical protein